MSKYHQRSRRLVIDQIDKPTRHKGGKSGYPSTDREGQSFMNCLYNRATFAVVLAY